jgi:hypothetical protein
MRPDRLKLGGVLLVYLLLAVPLWLGITAVRVFHLIAFAAALLFLAWRRLDPNPVTAEVGKLYTVFFSVGYGIFFVATLLLFNPETEDLLILIGCWLLAVLPGRMASA